jgi:hypothetical protein
MRPALLALLLAVFVPLAAAQSVYKCTEPGGRVVYTDNPNSCTGSVTQVEAPQQPGTAPSSAKLSDGERKLAREADQRAAALDKAYADIVASFNALRAAEARRDAGIEAQEGERQGRRHRPEYWQRQQALKHDVDDAQARLDDAMARRNALR